MSVVFNFFVKCTVDITLDIFFASSPYMLEYIRCYLPGVLTALLMGKYQEYSLSGGKVIKEMPGHT